MIIIPLTILLVLIFAAMVILFQRIMKQNVLLATKHLDEMSEDYSKKEQEINRQLEQTKQESQRMLSVAQEEAKRAKEEIIREAGVERDRIIQQAREQSEEMIQQADKSRRMLLAEINERINKGATDRACELIQATLPDKFKLDVHMHWVEELIAGEFSRFERLHIPKDAQEIKIVSAFELTDTQRSFIHKKLKEALGNEVSTKEEIDSGLVAGIIIYIGSLVLDGSLKNKIEEQSKSIQSE